MNFDFEKFRETCNDIDRVMDLRDEVDRKAFTVYMEENRIKHTDLGRVLPFVWFDSGFAVFGVDTTYPHTIIYPFRDFLAPEFDMDNILEFLGGE